jgi:chaperone required for assembly of F1-ATPase
MRLAACRARLAATSATLSSSLRFPSAASVSSSLSQSTSPRCLSAWLATRSGLPTAATTKMTKTTTRALVGGQAGCGRCLSNDVPIAVPEGAFKNTDDGPSRVSLEPRTTLRGRRRFYKHTGYREAAARPGHFEVLLDGRAVKAAGSQTLQVPSMDMAMMIAAEWGAQGKQLEPAAMPTMSMAATAQLLGDKRPTVIANMLKFVETDTVCVRSPPDEDERLVLREKKHWDPVVAWFRDQYGPFHTTDGFVMPDQPKETAAAVAAQLHALDDWRLTALQALVSE